MARIRLQSSPCLPSLKAWFLIPPAVTNIRDLKLALCSQLSIFKDTRVQPAHIVLEMDGFEVLEESHVDLLREGDVVLLKRQKISVSERQSEKRTHSMEFVTVEKSRKRAKRSPSSSSTSSSESTDSSSSESSSTSSSSSDSGSDSDTTSSNTAQLVFPTKRILPTIAVANRPVSDRHRDCVEMLRSKSQQPPVPPGFGKATTHARNKRRRIKRKFTAGQISAPGDVSTSTPNVHQSPKDKNGISSDDDISQELVAELSPPASTFRTPSASLGNKDTRMGKKVMESANPHKVTFDSAIRHASSSNPPLASIPPFVAPSARARLPKNLFVTSVDIEWRTGHGRTESQIDQDGLEAVHVVQTLDQEPHIHAQVDWKIIETHWDEYEKLQASTTLSMSAIVAWKAFGLDPVTLTPQASLLHVGRVIAMDTDNLIVLPLARPGIGKAAFGRAPLEQEMEDDVNWGEQISHPLPEVWSTDWKVISK